MLRYCLLVCLLPLLLSCASMQSSPRVVILQHPETLEFVNCEVDAWGTKKSFAEKDECVKKYIALGYMIWGSH